MTVDLAAALRRRRPEKRSVRLAPRDPSALTSAADVKAGKVILVADTNVYIRDAADTLGADAKSLLDRALLFHCSVCLGELATGVANADPGHSRWRQTRDHYAELFASVPTSRLLTPGADIWADAGLIAGTLARTQGFQSYQRKEVLNDALIFLTATKAGFPVLTANRDEFDLIQQVAPEGQFIHY